MVPPNRPPASHRNVVFLRRPAPIIRSKIDGGDSGEGIWKQLKGVKAITIPHTSADPRMGTDWREHNEEFERLAEMFQSCRGSYEHDGCPRQHVNATNKKGFVQLALARGYRFGIIASSDHGYGVAYAVVYAKGKTREDVFDALYNRRCYGSTSYGIVLDFRADGRLMGQAYDADKAPALSVYVRGAADVKSVEVIRDNEVVLKRDGAGKESKFEWTDATVAPGAHYYYVRVIQADDEMAWSSPIWVTTR